MTIPASAMSLPMLLAELVELGREAWRASERERAVRARLTLCKKSRRMSNRRVRRAEAAGSDGGGLGAAALRLPMGLVVVL